MKTIKYIIAFTLLSTFAVQAQIGATCILVTSILIDKSEVSFYDMQEGQIYFLDEELTDKFSAKMSMFNYYEFVREAEGKEIREAGKNNGKLSTGEYVIGEKVFKLTTGNFYGQNLYTVPEDFEGDVDAPVKATGLYDITLHPGFTPVNITMFHRKPLKLIEKNENTLVFEYEGMKLVYLVNDKANTNFKK